MVGQDKRLTYTKAVNLETETRMGQRLASRLVRYNIVLNQPTGQCTMSLTQEDAFVAVRVDLSQLEQLVTPAYEMHAEEKEIYSQQHRDLA